MDNIYRNKPEQFKKIEPYLNDKVILIDLKNRLTSGRIAKSTSNNPITNILFKDLLPIAVEALDFDITSASVEFFVAIATFKYRTFEVEAL